jgi:hypothetical protein
VLHAIFRAHGRALALFLSPHAELNKRQQERAGVPGASADAGYKAMMKNFDK